MTDIKFFDDVLTTIPKDYINKDNIQTFTNVALTGKDFNKYFNGIKLYKIDRDLSKEIGFNEDHREFLPLENSSNGIHVTAFPSYISSLYNCKVDECWISDALIPNDAKVYIHKNCIKTNKITLGEKTPYKE